MKTIEKVIIKNFQSHEYTELDFCSNLNVIIGSSDSGKTAVLRAIKWVLYNEPSGDEFIQKNKTEASVKLVFNTGYSVERFRSRSKNLYIIYDSQSNKEVFQGFGVGVPEEVQEITGVRTIDLDGKISNPINLAEQLDGAFLLSETDSVKASSIGRLVGVNIIDDALRESINDSRSLNSISRNYSEELEELKSERKTYDYLTDLEKKLDRLKELRTALGHGQELLSQLNRIRSGLEGNSLAVMESQQFLKEIGSMDRAAELSQHVEAKIMLHKSLCFYRTSLEEISPKIQREKTINKSLENLDNIDIDLISKKLISYRNIYTINSRLKEVLSIKDQALVYLKDLDQIELVESSYKSLLDLEERLANLKYIEKNYNKVLESLNIGLNYIDDFKNLDISHRSKDNIQELLGKLDYLTKKKDFLTSLRQEKSSLESNISSLDFGLDRDLKRYIALLKEHGVCPYCNSEIDSKHIDRIIDDYSRGMTV